MAAGHSIDSQLQPWSQSSTIFSPPKTSKKLGEGGKGKERATTPGKGNSNKRERSRSTSRGPSRASSDDGQDDDIVNDDNDDDMDYGEEGEGHTPPSTGIVASVVIPPLERPSKRARGGPLSWADISNGQAPLPVPAINEFDQEEFEPFTWVNKNTSEIEAVQEERLLEFTSGCSCVEDCDVHTCDHVQMLITPSIMAYTRDGRLRKELCTLDGDTLIEECNFLCSCNVDKCRNRVVGRGPKYHYRVFKTRHRGWGVQAMERIPRGAFVDKYVGKVIHDAAASTAAVASYMFDLSYGQGVDYVIDAHLFGNATRFINHSHDPNLLPIKVLTHTADVRIPSIAFFALRDIEQYEELTFRYGYPEPDNPEDAQIICRCGAHSCTGILL